MARGGITKVMVENARNRLLARGARPSIDNVRIELGNTGSKTTINRYLKELEESESTRLDDVELLSENLSQIVGRLASALRAEAQAIVESAEDAHAKAMAELSTENADQHAALESAEMRLEELEAALAQERDAHAAARESLSQATITLHENAKEIESAEKRLAEKDSQIESLETKNRHAVASLEHYRESAKIQRDQDLQRHDEQVRSLQALLKEQRDSLAAKQEQVTTLSESNARLATELNEHQRLQREAKGDLLSTEQALTALRDDHARLAANAVHTEQALATLEKAHAALQDRLADREQQLLAKDNEIRTLQAQVKAQETVYDRLHNQLTTLLQQRNDQAAK